MVGHQSGGAANEHRRARAGTAGVLRGNDGGGELRGRAPHRRPADPASGIPVLNLLLRHRRRIDARNPQPPGQPDRPGDGIPHAVDRGHARPRRRGVRDLHRDLRHPRRIPGEDRPRRADHQHRLSHNRPAHRWAGPRRGHLIGFLRHDLGLRRRQRDDHRDLHDPPDAPRRLQAGVRRRRRGCGVDGRRVYAADHGRRSLPARRTDRDQLFRDRQDRGHPGTALLPVGRADRLFSRRPRQAPWRSGRRAAAVGRHHPAPSSATADTDHDLLPGDRRFGVPRRRQDHRLDHHAEAHGSAGVDTDGAVADVVEAVSRDLGRGRTRRLLLWHANRRPVQMAGRGPHRHRHR